MRLVRVDDRSAGVVACVSGVAAAWSGAAPTGTAWSDAVLVFLAAAAVTWASASAPWWAVTLAAGIGALFAIDPLITVIGGAAAATGLWLGTQRRDASHVRVLLGAVTINVLFRMEFGGFLGATALIGTALAVLMLFTGLQRRHSVVRRRAFRSAIVLGGATVLAVAGLGVAALGARDDVTQGRQLVTEGVDLLRDGEYAQAAGRFDQAASMLESAGSAMRQPWAQPARLVPIAAQNRQAVVVISDQAAVAAAELANASLFIDPDDLRITDGRFDLDELAEIEQPLTMAYDSMVELRAGIDDVRSPWLFDAVETRLDAAAEEFDENVDQVDTAVEALRLAPDMLGGNGARHYFVAFTTPAEARGLGGFMGNYAVLTADDGALAMSEFGRTGDLNDAGDGTRKLDPPAEWDALWGRYGLTNGPGGTTGDVPWSNVTVSPHFPSTATVITDLFVQSGGRPVDGVFSIDPYVLQAMVGFTGPITIEIDGQETPTLTDKNTAEFLLFDQYLIEDAETRTDLLETVAEEVLGALLDGALPGPTVLADQLVPLADEGRLVGWMDDTAEQALFGRVGVSGGLPEHEGADGFQLVVNNAGANKLDAYLERSIRYRAEFEPETGVVIGTVDATFTNNGPTSGLPSGVIDNYVGDPIGTNRTLVTMYTALPVTSATLDGEVARFEPGVEDGWNTSTLYLVVPPGGSQTLSFTVAGSLPVPNAAELAEGVAPYQLVVGTQPLVEPVEYDLEVADTDGFVVFEFEGRIPGRRRFASESPDASAN